MKAMAITEFGGPETLQMRELPDPVPGTNDLLVEVAAAGLNPVDYKIRADGLGQERAFPLVLGYDVCGTVKEAGSSVRGFLPGDVIIASPSLARNGSNAELVCVDHRTAALKPANLGANEAGAIPLVALTAWEALYQRAGISAGQTVLIPAGGGGVGHIAVQLAKNRGCRVITSASREESIGLARSSGADVVVDYSKENLVERVMEETGGNGCPVVFDTVGGEVFEQCLDCVAVNGAMVSITFTAGAPICEKLFLKNATLHYEFMGIPAITGINIESHGKILSEVAALIDERKLNIHVSETFRLEDLAAAHRRQETGHAVGKIVIAVGG